MKSTRASVALLAVVSLLPCATRSLAVSITALNTAYTENFNALASSGTSSSLPSGWAFVESGTNANTTYTAGNGSGNTGDTYSFGATGSTERALGGLLSGSLVPLFGASFTNGTLQMITALDIAYTGEQWRLGANARADRLDFQYSTDAVSLTTGTWLDLDLLDFATPDTTGATTGAAAARDGNASGFRTALSSSVGTLSLAPGNSIWIRWIDFNASGADDGLAVDDFSITARGASVTTPESGMGTMPIGLLFLGMMIASRVRRLRGE